MNNAHFDFRQFGIRQDRCGMKVSMDACIFGAWIPFPETQAPRVLDIGAGTGLLSLMLAQRISSAIIDAIEIDEAAAVQARENIGDSIFRDRIQLIHGDARTFRPETLYDMIVSNPPFFSKSLHGPDAARNAARHDDGLNLETLFTIISQNLGDGGYFALLMPHDAEKNILKLAESDVLTPVRRLDIRERESSQPKRSCWLFSRSEADGVIVPESCVVRDGNSYSAAFLGLLDAFYLRL